MSSAKRDRLIADVENDVTLDRGNLLHGYNSP